MKIKFLIGLLVVGFVLINGCIQQEPAKQEQIIEIEPQPTEPQESTEEPIVVGGDCSYDRFKGECKITSILSENIIKFRFISDEPPNIEWVKKAIDREREQYAGYLGLKCLDKYPITKEDLERCNITENAIFDCELSVITSGTCTPLSFKFYTIQAPTCFKEGETFPYYMENVTCCKGLVKVNADVGVVREVGKEVSCVSPLTFNYICTKCGNGICEDIENWCNCPDDCEKPAKILCNEDIDCGKDFCNQGRNICYEIKYTCQEGNCSSVSVEYVNHCCARYYYPELVYPNSSKCMDTCGDGICKSPETKSWCPVDCG